MLLFTASPAKAKEFALSIYERAAWGHDVVDQSVGNEEAVAEHALAMMLTFSKHIVEADRRARTGQAIVASPISVRN